MSLLQATGSFVGCFGPTGKIGRRREMKTRNFHAGFRAGELLSRSRRIVAAHPHLLLVPPPRNRPAAIHRSISRIAVTLALAFVVRLPECAKV